MLFHIKLTKATKKKFKKLNPKKTQPTICRKTNNKQQTTYIQTNKPVLDPTLIFPSLSLPLFVVLFYIVIKSC